VVRRLADVDAARFKRPTLPRHDHRGWGRGGEDFPKVADPVDRAWRTTVTTAAKGCGKAPGSSRVSSNPSPPEAPTAT
jgi:hypothetical protein